MAVYLGPDRCIIWGPIWTTVDGPHVDFVPCEYSMTHLYHQCGHVSFRPAEGFAYLLFSNLRGLKNI